MIRLRCAVVILALVLLAGCSSDGASDGSVASTTTARPATTTSSTPEPAVRASAGCGTAPAVAPRPEGAKDTTLELEVGGTSRSYRFALPTDYDPEVPAPVVLSLHGSGSNAEQQSVYTQLTERGGDRGYLVVTPDAIDGKWQLTAEGTDDDFLMALLDEVEAGYCVDLDRVSTAGISLGSYKASATACAHPDRIATMVLVAEEVALPGCSRSVLAFHGTADAIVPYGEGADDGVVVTGSNGGLSGAEVNMPAWAEQAGCSTTKDVERLEPDVEHWTYRDCPEGFEVEFYQVEGGGHTWPGGLVDVGHLGPKTDTISATDLALDWFDAHPLVS